MQEQIGLPACFFSSGENNLPDDPTAITRSGQSVFASVYRTKLGDRSRLITITWCKNLLLRGLSVSVENLNGDNSQYICRVELKPWYFWKKHGSKRLFLENNKPVDIYWDLRAARFKGETEPASDYYVAIVCDDEVVLVLGNLRKEAYRKTKCRPALIDPILVSRKEHVFGKKRFLSRLKFHDKGGLHEVSVECKNRINNNNGVDQEMEIRIDGHLAIHVKHLQWKFRGNESVHFNGARLDVYWDLHDWFFSPGLRHALFVFKPTFPSNSTTSPSSFSGSSSLPASSGSSPSSSWTGSGSSGEGLLSAFGEHDFCLFLYAWRVD